MADWKYDSGFPSVGSGTLENLQNTIIAEGVRSRLSAANNIAALNKLKTEVCTQPSRQGESCADKLFGPIAEDLMMIGDFCKELSDQRKAKRKLMNAPMPKKTDFVSTTKSL